MGVGTGVRRARRIAGYAWASPCSAVGLLLAAPALLAGANARRVDGVVEVALATAAWAPRLARMLPFNAITFGHVVIATSAAEHDRLRAHERVHVRQYERWGLAFFVAYPLASLWQWLKGRHPYLDNGFEVQARREASGRP
jgi:hypothetical protein